MDLKAKFKSIWAVIKKVSKRVWEYLKVAKMEYIVMVSLFVVDLVSKAIVNANVGLYDSVVLIPKFLNITNIHNYDAAFGASWLTDAIGDMGARILFSIFAVAASVVFIIVLIRARGGSKVFRIAFAMVTAGAMGNCIDRMFLGYVRDFIEFEYFGLTILGSTSFWVFNIADSALVIGVAMIVIYFIFLYRDKDDVKNADNAATVDAPKEANEAYDAAADEADEVVEAADAPPDTEAGDSGGDVAPEDLSEDGGEKPEAEGEPT